MILLALIALIGIIAIIIVKLYYKDKEKDDDKEKLEEFLRTSDYNRSIESHKNIDSNRKSGKRPKNPERKTRSDRGIRAEGEETKTRRIRKTRKASPNDKYANLSEAQIYANTLQENSNNDLFVDYYNEPVAEDGKRAKRPVQQRVKAVKMEEAENARKSNVSTAQLLRQRAAAAKNIPKQAVVEGEVIDNKVAKAETKIRKVPRTPDRVKAQMNKEEEVKAFQEPIKPEHTATINSVNKEESEVKARQVPMTEAQKEFISSETAQKLVVDNSDENVKVVKSIQPAKDLEETKKEAKIEAEEESETTEAKAEAKEEKVEATEEKTEAETKTSEEKVETTEEKPKVETKTSEEKVETTEEKPKEETKTSEEETKATETKTETKTSEEETKATETKAETKEEKAETTTEKVEAKEEKPEEAKTVKKVSRKVPKPEEVYHDDLHLLLNKETKKDESPEDEFVKLNTGNETETGGNDLIRDAIKSIRNFRGGNTSEEVPEKPVEEAIVEAPNDYIHDFGNGIEEIGDTITITPIHEEEPNDLAYNQPNEDVDNIYKEINDKDYNKTIDSELDKSYEGVTDETSEKDANSYTKEDYMKTEKAEKDKKLREENTKKILNLRGDKKSKARSSRKSSAPQKQPGEGPQKQLILNEQRNDIEEVYINGTLYELKNGQTVMFEYNGETYSSPILRLKPGYIGVKYRSKKVWIKVSSVKKILN